MAKRHEQDLRIVQGVVEAQIAERDAEIARLGTEVEDMVGQIAYLNRQLNEANQIVRAGEAERKALAAQVAELEAWKASVPVKELNRMMTVAPFDSVEADIVWKWLKFSR